MADSIQDQDYFYAEKKEGTKEGRSRLISVEVCVELAKVDVDSYIRNWEEGLRASSVTSKRRETKKRNKRS